MCTFPFRTQIFIHFRAKSTDLILMQHSLQFTSQESRSMLQVSFVHTHRWTTISKYHRTSCKTLAMAGDLKPRWNVSKIISCCWILLSLLPSLPLGSLVSLTLSGDRLKQTCLLNKYCHWSVRLFHSRFGPLKPLNRCKYGEALAFSMRNIVRT